MPRSIDPQVALAFLGFRRLGFKARDAYRKARRFADLPLLLPSA